MHITSSVSRSARAKRPSSSLFNTLFRWDALFRQHTHLTELDAHLRRDLGLSEADIIRETGRARWDAPRHWLG